MLETNRKLVLTFDVELWDEGEWLKPYITPDMYKVDTFPDSMKNILNLLEKYAGHATFFITLKVAEKYPEIVKTISDKGHEVCIHGPRHKKLKDYPREEFKRDCIEHIRLIEKITGKRPVGYRAPHFSLNKQTYWVLDILKELGFIYDSSVFPKNMGEYGDSKSLKDPYEIIPSLTEIPVSVSSLFGRRFPYAGGIYFRILPFWIFKFFLNKELKSINPVIFFHPHELDGNTPKIKTGPILRIILKYWGVKNSFQKLEKMLSAVKFTSINTCLK